jgi:hypothetical protein
MDISGTVLLACIGACLVFAAIGFVVDRRSTYDSSFTEACYALAGIAAAGVLCSGFVFGEHLFTVHKNAEARHQVTRAGYQLNSVTTVIDGYAWTAKVVPSEANRCVDTVDVNYVGGEHDTYTIDGYTNTSAGLACKEKYSLS